MVDDRVSGQGPKRSAPTGRYVSASQQSATTPEASVHSPTRSGKTETTIAHDVVGLQLSAIDKRKPITRYESAPFVPPELDVFGLALLGGTLALLISGVWGFPQAGLFVAVFVVLLAAGAAYSVWRSKRSQDRALVLAQMDEREERRMLRALSEAARTRTLEVTGVSRS